MAGTILDRYPDPGFERDAFDHLGDYGTGSFELARADGLNEEAAAYRSPSRAVFTEQRSKWVAAKKQQRKQMPTIAGDNLKHRNPNGIYKPIEDQYGIRVLEIYPGERDDPLKASLVHCTVEFEYERVLMVPNTTGPYIGLKTKHVHSMDLGKPVFYTALSYTWGSGGFDAKIECDGHPLPITVSLETALRHFRRKDHTIIMWIDQICIDQSDDEEKKQQIPLMSKIYSRALNTAIWLGEGIDRRRRPRDQTTTTDPACNPKDDHDDEDDEDDEVDGMTIAFDLLRQIRVNLQFHADTSVGPADLPRLLLPPATAEAWTLLRALFDRPWFRRLWVIQEAILSDSPWMVCGTTTTDSSLTAMPFEEFSNACSTIILSGLHRLPALYDGGEAGGGGATLSGCRTALDLSHQREQFMQFQHPPKLIDALVFTRYARCYFPHDKVYGLLGVCDQPRGGVVVDYKRDAGELYRELAITFLEDAMRDLERAKRAKHSPDLRVSLFSVFDVLIGVDHEPAAVVREEEGGVVMASWVPDWRRARVTEALGHSTSTLAFYEAGGRADPGLVINPDGRELSLSGKVFDVVGKISPAFSEPHLGLPRSAGRGNDLLTCLELVRTCYPCKEPCEYVSGCKMFGAFWQTLVAGKDESGKQRCPQNWSMIFSLLLDAATGTKHSIPDQEYDKRQELPDDHKGKVTVAHLGNWDAQGSRISSVAGNNVQQNQDQIQGLGAGNGKGKRKQKEGKKPAMKVGQRKLAKTFQDVQTAVRHAMRNRRFGITDKKYIGLFPNHAQEGDVICVFSGCHVPFVLRRRKDGETFQLVGECYIHGAMGGEIMSMEAISLGRVRLA